MTAMWMLYALGLATLVGAAAACLEPVLRTAGRATRALWAAALVLSLSAPAAVWVAARRTPPASERAVRVATGARSDASTLEALLARARVRDVMTPDAATRWEMLDHPLLIAWLAASVLALGWLGLSHRRLRAALRAWRPATVAGEPVLLSSNVGPAAVAAPGDGGGRIVLPTWALELGERSLALMLAHERSHLRARDPQLLAGATIAVALAPWNPALWWQLRRLRLAVELDCDRRVLRRHPDVAAYGALLLDVARRVAPARLPLAAFAALSAPTPSTALERRIRTMTSRRTRHVVARALALGALGTGLAIAACEAPHPTAPRPSTRVPLTEIKSGAPELASVNGGPSLEMVRTAIRDHIPAVASGAAHATRIWLVADHSGQIVKAAFDDRGADGNVALRGSTIRFRADSHTVVVAHNAMVNEPGGDPSWLKTLDPSTIATVDVMKLGPGRVTPDSVGVIWIVLRDAASVRAPSASPAEGAVKEARGSFEGTEGRVRVSVNESGQATGLAVGPADSSAGRANVGGASPAVGAARTSGVSKRFLRVPDGQNPPLYIVDGRELPAGEEGQKIIDALRPDAIEGVSVYKGENALQRFGPRAVNGAVTITTKQRSTLKYD